MSQLTATMNDRPVAQKYNNSAFYDPEAVTMLQVNENKDARLAVTSMLDNYVQALVP